MNLRRIVHSQRVLSGGIAELAANVDDDLRVRCLARQETYADLQRELRNVGSLIGTGELAVADSADVIGRLKALRPDADVDLREVRHLALQAPFRGLHADPVEGAKPVVRAHASAAGEVEVDDEGAFADITLFDPQSVDEAATFEKPIQPARGIHAVLVNGAIVWRDGRPTGEG